MTVFNAFIIALAAQCCLLLPAAQIPENPAKQPRPTRPPPPKPLSQLNRRMSSSKTRKTSAGGIQGAERRLHKRHYRPDDSVKRGDVIVEAVYERKQRRKNCQLKITSTNTEDWTAIGADIQKIVMAGDGEYSAVFGSIEKVSGTLDKHYLIDMNTVETMDMTHPWWDKEVIDIFGFGTGKAFMACGEINFWDDLSTVCLYFNKSLMDAKNFPIPMTPSGTISGPATPSRF